MKVKFVPQNIELEINPGQSILDLAQQNDIHIQSVCKGIPSCAECRIYIKEGEYNVMPPQPKELELIGTAYFVDQRRLSCQLRCFGDVTIDLTEQNEKQHKSTKNPQGRYVKEREDSHARMGNVLEELTEEEMAYESELIKSESSSSDGSTQSNQNKPKQRIDNKSFYSVNTNSESNQNKQQNSNQNNKQDRNRQNQKNRNPNQASGQNPSQKQNAGSNPNQRPKNPNQSPMNQNQSDSSIAKTDNPNQVEGANAKRNRNRRRNKNRNAKKPDSEPAS